MSKHNHEQEYAFNQAKRFFSRQLRGGFVGARVRQQLTYGMILFSLAALLFSAGGDAQARALLATAPPLGAAANFAVLAATTVTNAGAGGTIVNGDLGVSPGTSVTGFSPGDVVGTIHSGDAAAAAAQVDAATAYTNLTSQACDVTYPPVQDIGGLTLTPGVYCFPSSAGITGNLTLDAQGNPNAVFVFKTVSTLVTASNAQVLLINGATACNVFWAVGSSATLGTGTSFAGNILAVTSNTVTTNASVNGRVIALGAAVTLDTNLISGCTPAPPLTTLIVQKIVINNSGGTLVASNFSFQINGATAVPFEADGQIDLTVNPGTFNITEPAVAGYTTTYNNCANVVIGSGGTATCTITNDDQPANLIVQKVVINNSGGTLVASNFSFQVNAAAAVAFEAGGQNNLIVDAGIFNVTEVAVAGYTTTYNNCTNVAIGIGGTATCTITNDDQPANLIVQKVVINNSGGTLVASNFSFQVNAAAAVAFEAGGQNNLIVDAGIFNVTEVAVAGYTTTYNNCTNVAIGIGGTATCTITNDDQPANLIVQKVVINNSGGTLVASNFSFQVNAAAAVAFEADGQNDLTVAAGTYNVTEPAVAGYTTTYNNCANVVVSNSGTATCTITNDDLPANLIVQKVVVNNSGGTLVASNFSFQVNAAAAVPFEADGQNNLIVNAGTFNVTEVAVAGYTTTYNNCANVVIGIGGTATCTITNDDIAPAPGRVEIDKVFCPSNDGTRTEFQVLPPQESSLASASLRATCETRAGVAFTVKNSNGQVVANVQTVANGIVQFELPPGIYTLIEDANGASTTFLVEAGKLTAIFVRNFESGEVKLVKFFCTSGDTGTIISINGTPQPQDLTTCQLGNAQFQIDGGLAFKVGKDGLIVITLAVGQHTIVEVATGASARFTVRVGKTTTIIVYNFPSSTPTAIPTNTSTNTPTPTKTPKPTLTPTPTNTPRATKTPAPPTSTPRKTNTPLPPTNTPTNTPIPPTLTPTNTPTMTPTPGSGEVKLMKFFCTSGDTGTIISVDGVPQPKGQNGCQPGNAQFKIDGGPAFGVGSDGIHLFPLAAGTHNIVEVATGKRANFTVRVGKITTIVVYNFR